MSQRAHSTFACMGMLFTALLWLCAMPAWAQNRAWVDRDRIGYDETTTFHLEVDVNTTRAIPDLSGITRDFRIVDQNMQQEMRVANGAMNTRITLRLTLQPMRDGMLEIPSLQIGNDTTRALRVWVTPSRAARPAAEAPSAISAQPIFIEARVDNEAPYVQQTVGYTVRLYYASGILIDGRVDHDPPEGATLQKIGDDLQLTQRIGDSDYNVVERRFLLIPERGGAVTVPGARFLGRAMGLFDNAFDGSRKEQRIRGNPITLQVKPIPATAPQPWLPLRGLRLRYLETPQSLRVGDSAAITIEAVADGAIATQLPALTLRSGDGAQLFPEPAQPQDRFVDGRPQATIVRRVLVMPTREGALRIAGPRLEWWDAEAGIARSTSLPDITLRVSPGAARAVADGSEAAEVASAATATPWYAWRPQGLWAWAMLALPLLWGITLGLAWQLWSMRRRQASPAVASARVSVVDTMAPPSPPADAQAWARALARGDAAELARMLCAMASPPVADLDAVRARLADPAQRAAVDALQRARWGDGDTAVAVAAVRTAFAAGPRWRTQAAHVAPALLPPLYPEA